MLENLIFLPKSVSAIALLALLAAGIYEFRHSHIGRVGIFANSMLLWQIFYDTFYTSPMWFQGYLNIGTIIGLIALGAYLVGQSLPTKFYQICFIAYGSISVIFIILIFGHGMLNPVQQVIKVANNVTNGTGI